MPHKLGDIYDKDARGESYLPYISLFGAKMPKLTKPITSIIFYRGRGTVLSVYILQNT